jgi:hypothetical protein
VTDDEDSNEIKEVAREQLETERRLAKMQEIMGDMSEQLVEDAKDARGVKQKRMALEEVRKVSKDIEENQDEQQKLQEQPLEDLFDELIRLTRKADQKRRSGESEEPA